jgi:zinc/manganese transport system substrate-binding protein
MAFAPQASRPRPLAPAARHRHRGPVAVGLALLTSVLAACGSAASTPSGAGQPSRRHLSVVAGENFWGSIASQLGGSRVSVTSIVTDPNADPHDYESDTGDARAFATADYVILNGAGYDGWAEKLLAGNPEVGRRVLTVADLLGRTASDNPHFWYSPDDVERVADRITADLRSMDAADGGYLTIERSAFETALQPYHHRIAAIRTKDAGKRVASTESIFVGMADALGLVVVSPPAFMKAVAEGNDPPADSVAAFERLIQGRRTDVLVVNVQTSTDVTTTIRQMAARQGIPIVSVTETIQPPDATFQEWQLGQLNALQNALDAEALAR